MSDGREPLSSIGLEDVLDSSDLPVTEEFIMATSQLRWSRDGVLEQLWVGTRGSYEWRPVPREDEG